MRADPLRFPARAFCPPAWPPANGAWPCPSTTDSHFASENPCHSAPDGGAAFALKCSSRVCVPLSMSIFRVFSSCHVTCSRTGMRMMRAARSAQLPALRSPAQELRRWFGSFAGAFLLAEITIDRLDEHRAGPVLVGAVDAVVLERRLRRFHLVDGHAFLHHVTHAIADDRHHVPVFDDVGLVRETSMA